MQLRHSHQAASQVDIVLVGPERIISNGNDGKQWSDLFFSFRSVTLLMLKAEFLTRVRHFVKPSPNVVHYILTHFHWLWDIVNNTFLRDVLMRLVLTGSSSSFKSTVTYLLSAIFFFNICLFCLTVRSNLIPSPPTYNSKYGYLSWESYYNLSYYTRLLPPVPEDCPTPLGVKG